MILKTLEIARPGSYSSKYETGVYELTVQYSDESGSGATYKTDLSPSRAAEILLHLTQEIAGVSARTHSSLTKVSQPALSSNVETPPCFIDSPPETI